MNFFAVYMRMSSLARNSTKHARSSCTNHPGRRDRRVVGDVLQSCEIVGQSGTRPAAHPVRECAGYGYEVHGEHQSPQCNCPAEQQWRGRGRMVHFRCSPVSRQWQRTESNQLGRAEIQQFFNGFDNAFAALTHVEKSRFLSGSKMRSEKAWHRETTKRAASP